MRRRVLVMVRGVGGASGERRVQAKSGRRAILL